jgi:callose synthase
MFVLHVDCEHAYTLAQSLDPNSEARGVLQFKTGLFNVSDQGMFYVRSLFILI